MTTPPEGAANATDKLCRGPAQHIASKPDADLSEHTIFFVLFAKAATSLSCIVKIRTTFVAAEHIGPGIDHVCR